MTITPQQVVEAANELLGRSHDRNFPPDTWMPTPRFPVDFATPQRSWDENDWAKLCHRGSETAEYSCETACQYFVVPTYAGANVGHPSYQLTVPCRDRNGSELMLTRWSRVARRIRVPAGLSLRRILPVESPAERSLARLEPAIGSTWAAPACLCLGLRKEKRRADRDWPLRLHPQSSLPGLHADGIRFCRRFAQPLDHSAAGAALRSSSTRPPSTAKNNFCAPPFPPSKAMPNAYPACCPG